MTKWATVNHSKSRFASKKSVVYDIGKALCITSSFCTTRSWIQTSISQLNRSKALKSIQNWPIEKMSFSIRTTPDLVSLQTRQELMLFGWDILPCRIHLILYLRITIYSDLSKILLMERNLNSLEGNIKNNFIYVEGIYIFSSYPQWPL